MGIMFYLEVSGYKYQLFLRTTKKRLKLQQFTLWHCILFVPSDVKACRLKWYKPKFKLLIFLVSKQYDTFFFIFTDKFRNCTGKHKIDVVIIKKYLCKITEVSFTEFSFIVFFYFLKQSRCHQQSKATSRKLVVIATSQSINHTT